MMGVRLTETETFKRRRMTPRGYTVQMALPLVAALLTAAFCGVSSAQSFSEQRKIVAVSPLTQPESAIANLLKAGLAEGHPAEAIAETQKWLQQNVPEDARLLYQAGRAAELSGDWKDAVALYQQYLARADLKSSTADDAVYAVYTLLIERLKDSVAAYTFGRTAGDRLIVCPRARQFDTWFLDEAVKRRDVLSVARRLRACIDAGFPTDLLIARYDNYFRWLLGQVKGSEDYRGGYRRVARLSQETADTVKGLAKAMRFFEELRLQLDWAVSVKFYVQQRLDEAQVSPPIAEAKALLAKYPRHALRVQTGWAGGSRDNHPNHVGDYKYYWKQEINAKFAPIVEAAAKLPPMERAKLVASWRPRYYNRQRDTQGGLASIPVISDYLTNNPNLVQELKYVSPLTKEWHQYTPEVALELAPRLAKNRHPDASLLRAIAAGVTRKTVGEGEKERTEYTKDLDKMMAALRGPEAWRMTSGLFNGRVTDRFWHYCDRPGGNKKRDAEIAKSKQFGKKQARKLVAKDAPENQKIAQFRTLWKDYRSAQPKTSGVRHLLRQVVQFTPEVIPELLDDSSGQAKRLVRHALGNGMTGSGGMWQALDWRRDLNTRRYDPLMVAYIHRHRGMKRIKEHYPTLCQPHPLEESLRKAVTAGLQKKRLSSWMVIAWVNAQWPEENVAQKKLAQRLVKSAAWQSLSFEARFAVREMFKTDAMTSGQIAWMDAADSAIVCKDLLALKEDADAATTAAALSKAIEGVKHSPAKIHVQGLDRLAAVDESVFLDEEVFPLVLQIIDWLRESVRADAFGKRIFALIPKECDTVVMHRAAFYLWQKALSNPRSYFEPTKKFVKSLIDKSPSVSLALARMGQSIFTGHRSYGFSWQKAVSGLKAIEGKASIKVGLISIPVSRNHPAHPVYQAQAEWLSGNEDSAWALCDQHWEELLPIHRKLTIDYLMWVLQRTIYSRDEYRQETLVTALRSWAQNSQNAFTLEQRARLDLAYGDIAVQRGMLGEAHKIFNAALKNEAYDGMLLQIEAGLRRVRVERMNEYYDQALDSIRELELMRIPEMWAAIRYARAEVFLAMGELDDAAEDLESILARDEGFADAKILLGQVDIKRNRLIETTEIEVVPATEQDTLVPGEKLKVTLNDQTLSVAGAGTAVEVVVEATSGDKETFLLRQFGDKKTKFRGEVDSALGKPAPNDGVLQLIGDDEIYYAYSDAFLKKMNNMQAHRGGPITVASDAILMASARRLPTVEEQRLADMEAMLESLSKKGGGSRARAAVKSTLAAKAALEASNLADDVRDGEIPVEIRVKPGNPLHVRVVDPDKSRTANVDELLVSVQSSSGDVINRITLKETETHSGKFEGEIPTAGAQAMAFASDSEPGRNPNMVISPNDAYPTWRPIEREGVTPTFRVDLNDNVQISELSIVSKEAGSRLKRFVLETGMNARDMRPVVSFPKSGAIVQDPWHPSVVVMNDTDHHHARNERSVYDLDEISYHINRGFANQQYAQAISTNVPGVSAAFPAVVTQAVRWRRQQRHDVSHLIHRFRGYFYEDEEVIRRFKLDLGEYRIPKKTHSSVRHPAQHLLAVDGRPITEAEGELEGAIKLRKGLHRFEIWSTGWSSSIGFGRDATLYCNLAGGEAWETCPDSFFDPARIPSDVKAHRNQAATVEPAADGNSFTVTFAPGSRTRLFNLVMSEHEGPVPALNKLELTGVDGKRLLPVKQDFAALNKNDTLEMLVGDKVTVRYVDDRVVTKKKRKLERFLEVAFSDAEVSFTKRFVIEKNLEKEIVYRSLLRFAYDDPVHLQVVDPDMDVSAEPDKIELKLAVGERAARKVTAVESGPSTGIFHYRFVPVAQAPSSSPGLQVGEGEVVQATYWDAENSTPGVPVARIRSAEHAAFEQPQLSLTQPEVTALPPENRPDPAVLFQGFYTPDSRARHRMSLRARREFEASKGLVVPRWAVTNEFYSCDAPPPDGGGKALFGKRLYLKVRAPQDALGTFSTAEVFVQTESGRKLVQQGPAGFNTDVPGTLKLTGALSTAMRGVHDWRGTPRLSSYWGGGNPDSWRERSDDTFTFSVPVITGVIPRYGAISKKERYDRGLSRPNGLVAKPDDTIHIGFRYRDRAGTYQWETAETKVVSHPALDVMEEDYRRVRKKIYVGEVIYIRVVDLGSDLTDACDTVSVLMQARSGARHRVTLRESAEHSGIFRGGYLLTYADKQIGSASSPAEPYDVKRQGFPVVYGDQVKFLYEDRQGVKTDVLSLTVSKGADGSVVPFTKRFQDDEIAMRTQFALAEGYLELAKRHRKLGETRAAALEYARAKQLLSASMDAFQEADTRAHAEYLLGTLTMEEADTTPKGDLREDRFRAALSRFMNVTGNYPDSLYASMAQYRIASVYEDLGEPEIAAQEYVKLAYKYPDSEFVALSMAKLGTHFLRSAAAYEARAKPFLAKPDDKDAQFEAEALTRMARREYLKAGKIFGRLEERFPATELAGKGGLRAGQSYMRAGEFGEAVRGFKRIIDNEDYDGKTLRAQSMYWAGKCYVKLRDPMAAYAIFKRCTYDFPETKWAAYSQAELSTDSFHRIEMELEIKQLEEGR